jgi:hypothetical protein
VISISNSARKAIAGGCFFLGSIWAAAGVFKMIFGVRITFSLLPPLGLERVDPLPALVVAFGFCVLGAWLERTSRELPLGRTDLDAGESRYDLPYGASDTLSASDRRSTASSRDRLTQ